MNKPLTFPASGGRDFVQVEPGSEAAVCDMVVYMGLQPGGPMYPEPRRSLYLRFEVPAQRVTYSRDGKDVDGAATIGEELTASMSAKANLRHQLEGWRGRAFTDPEAEAFDIRSLLGKACLLNIGSKARADGKMRSRITAIGKLPRGMPAPALENEPLFYSVDEPDPVAFERLPKWLRDRLQAPAAPAAAAQVPDSDGVDPGDFTDDDIPF